MAEKDFRFPLLKTYQWPQKFSQRQMNVLWKLMKEPDKKVNTVEGYIQSVQLLGGRILKHERREFAKKIESIKKMEIWNEQSLKGETQWKAVVDRTKKERGC